MTSPHSRDPGSVQQALRRAQPAAHYDVERGLVRHRELLRAGAPLPEWGRGLGAGRRLRPSVLLSTLALFGLVAFVSLRGTTPAPAAEPAAIATAPTHAPAGTAAPRLDDAPAPRSVAALVPRAPEPTVTALPAAQSPEASAHPQREPARAEPPRAAAVRPAATPRGPTQPRPSAAPKLAVASAGAAGAPSADPLLAELAAGHVGPAPAAEPPALAPAGAGAGTPEAIDPEVLDEMQQLAIAERLLPTMPSRTLSLVREGMQRFPRGYLAQERRYLEIMALLALKRPKDAELLSRGFLRDYPNGPYRRKIERALDEGAHD